MITWMQHHKKYLVVTIWISVIAFIGAGFVGWGAYDLNSDRASAVAKVGDRKITVQEFQLAYSNYYSYYNNILGGKLTQEKADQMGLQKMVLENVINQTLFLSYADEIGLRVQESEVKNLLVNDDSFKVDGVFNKDAYYRVIKNSGIKAKDYEIRLKKQLLLDKVQKFLKLPPTKNEKEMFVASMFMKDKLSVDIITLSPGEAEVSEDQIKKYWNENKTKYLSEKSYDLDTITVALTDEPIDETKLKEFYQEKKYNYKNSEGKILKLKDARAKVEKDFRLKATKRVALENYLLFKKDQMEATGKKNVKISDTTFPIDKLTTTRVGEVLKPIATENGYIIVKIKKVNNPLPKSYADAKPAVLAQLQIDNKTKALKEKAEARLNLFEGKDIGFVSRDTVTTIPGLTEAQSLELINFIFDNNKMRNYKIIDNKAVLYQIKEQKLLEKGKLKKYSDLVNENISQMKQAEISNNLIKELKKRYKIEQYYKGN
ncbi:peptidylprolyl isomerase [Sulfurospirillum arcachonense]|uniref:peptidylprolyl isomerase n=1 Tax=Sulfurospirillum arcachonense TaxID=57666 RepID=UPI000467EF4B|nr:peptidylprolyl isomerase [Sulfurospirillum arcachonense]